MSRGDSFRNRLSPYLDGALDAAERREMELHLTSCTDCREELAALRVMVDQLRAFEAPQAPDLVAGVRRKLDARSWPSLGWAGIFSRLPNLSLLHGVALATVAVLVVFVVTLPGAFKTETVALRQNEKTEKKVADFSQAAVPQSIADVLSQRMEMDSKSFSRSRAVPNEIDELSRATLVHRDKATIADAISSENFSGDNPQEPSTVAFVYPSRAIGTAAHRTTQPAASVALNLPNDVMSDSSRGEVARVDANTRASADLPAGMLFAGASIDGRPPLLRRVWKGAISEVSGAQDRLRAWAVLHQLPVLDSNARFMTLLVAPSTLAELDAAFGAELAFVPDDAQPLPFLPRDLLIASRAELNEAASSDALLLVIEFPSFSQ